MRLTNLINYALHYVIQQSQIYNIDESHSLKHSLQVFRYANEIYNAELVTNPFLQEQEDIIVTACLLHDMCDKKYVDEKESIKELTEYMKEQLCKEKLDVICQIIETMSYSKVKKNGYPELQKYQLAYHIVREADLLAGYDVDRCIMYSFIVEKLDFKESIKRCIDLFDKRIFNYIRDDLYVTKTSKEKATLLHSEAILDIEKLKVLLKSLT